MAYQPGVLACYSTASKDDEVGYAPNVETRSEARVFVRVDLQYDGMARHLGSGARNFRSSRTTRSAPRRPEIYEHGNLHIFDDLI